MFLFLFLFQRHIKSPMIIRKKRTRYKINAARLANELGVKIDTEDWTQVWAFLEKHGEPTYLYAIFDGGTKLVKFGKSNSPATRLKTLRVGNASKLTLLGYCREASPLTEKEVHKKLRGNRVGGEWFLAGGETQDVINSIRTAHRNGK